MMGNVKKCQEAKTAGRGVERLRNKLGPEYSDAFLYFVDPDTADLLRDDDRVLAREVAIRVAVRARERASPYSVRRVLVFPRYGRRVALMECEMSKNGDVTLMD